MKIIFVLFIFFVFFFSQAQADDQVTQPAEIPLSEMLQEKREAMEQAGETKESSDAMKTAVEKVMAVPAGETIESSFDPANDYEPLKGSVNLRKQDKPPFRPKRD